MEAKQSPCGYYLQCCDDDNDNRHPPCDCSLFNDRVSPGDNIDPYSLCDIVEEEQNVEQKQPHEELIVQRPYAVIKKDTMVVKIFCASVAALTVVAFLVHVRATEVTVGGILDHVLHFCQIGV